MSDVELVYVFMPSLLYLLSLAEEEEGRPLTKDEVLKIRDNALCIAMHPERLKLLEESRGGQDLDPHNIWEEWCAYKSQDFC